MSELDDVIDDVRSKLRQAYDQANGNDAVRHSIKAELVALADLQEDMALNEFLKQATILNRLSGILDRAIDTIKHNIENFFLDDLQTLKKEVDTKAGKKPASPGHLPEPSPSSPLPSPPAVPPATLLAQPTAGFRRPNGPLVTALQIALIRAGQAIEPDGDFGLITTGALRRWQKANGFSEGGAIDVAQWAKLTSGAPPAPFDICLNITADYEGTSFDRVVGNFDGAGITFGLIGFTLANGEIGRLLTKIESLRPGAISSAFGALYSEFMSVLGAPKADRIRWADNISLGTKKYEVAKPWKDAFQRIGTYPEARRAQIEHAYDVYWAIAKKYVADFMEGKPITMEDAAFWFDTSVQNKIGEAERDELKTAAASNLSGGELRNAFAKIIAAGSLPSWRKDVLSRKMTFVDGTGDVHGSNYSLMAWGINRQKITLSSFDARSSIIDLVIAGTAAWQDDITQPNDEAGEATMVGGSAPVAVLGPSPHASWPLYAKFKAFADALGLRHFEVDELLFLGSQNMAGPCKGSNDYPPENLWPNIAPTAAVLDKLREELGTPVRILSVYRAPVYNKCIDGAAANSFHMQFNAIDFECDAGSPASWAAKLKEYRSRGVFAGGIGVYNSFVHVDTRGTNANWTG